MRGRKPKPRSLQVSEGDPRKRGKKKLAQLAASEPRPTRGTPPCPAHVSGLARSMWKFWAEQLAEMKLDYQCDAAVLEGACVNYALAVRADKVIEKKGLTVEISEVVDDGVDERGEPKFRAVVIKVQKRPEVGISNAAWMRVRSFCSEMGLSLVSRTRLSIDKNEKVEDLAAILSRPREPRPTVQSTVPPVIQ